MEHLDLADGSRIELNTDTRLTVSYTPAERVIYLKHGEAHFVVVSDKHRPFVVYTDIGAVRAVGTAFRVRVLEADVEVTVADGIVDLDLLAPTDSPVKMMSGLPQTTVSAANLGKRLPVSPRA